MNELFSSDAVANRTAQFVEMFRRVKAEKKGRKCILKGLNPTDEKKLREVFKRKHTLEEIELAVRAMFEDPEQWAVKTGNDIPTHFLNQFDRYLGMIDRAKKEPEKPKVLTEQEKEEREKELQRLEWLRTAKAQYSKDLVKGVWTGTISDAISIGSLFASSFTPKEKSEFFAQAKRKSVEETVRAGSTTTAMEAMLMALATPENFFSEIVVQEAVKRKIKEPWSQK